jgi:hypothetical protein
MTLYCTREDIYVHGIPRGALVSRGRLVGAVDVTSNTLELEGHGLEAGAAVQFRAGDGGALPAPLSSSAVYYALPVSGSDSLLRVAMTEGGEPVNLSSSGVSPVLLMVSLGPQLDRAIEVFSRWVDSLCIDQAVPFAVEAVPMWVRHLVAKRVAADMARTLGLGAQADQIFEAERQAIADGQRLARGGVLRDASAASPTNLARGASPTDRGRWATSRDRDVP